MGSVRLAVLLIIVAACAGSPPTPSPVPTPTPSPSPAPTATPSPTPTPPPTATPTPAVAAGFTLTSAALFHVAVPAAWTASATPADEKIFHATSPLGGAEVTIYRSPDGLGDKSLVQYVTEGQDILEGLWDTQVVRTEVTVAGVPALRLAAVQTFLETKSHLAYYFEQPVGSGDVWSIGLDNDGTEPDPAFETVIDSFGFGP